MTRTKEGENLFKSAEKAEFLKTRAVEEDDQAVNLLVRLANRKHGLKAGF